MSGDNEQDGFGLGAEAAWNFAVGAMGDLGEATVRAVGGALDEAGKAIDLLASYGDAVLNAGAIAEVPELIERNSAFPATVHRDAPLPEDFNPYGLWNRTPR